MATMALHSDNLNLNSSLHHDRPSPPTKSTLSLCLPSTHNSRTTITTTTITAPFTPPTPHQLSGTWTIHTSSNPFWADKHNVRITYSPVASTKRGTTSFAYLDDIAQYETRPGGPIKELKGSDSIVVNANAGAGVNMWVWQGRGLMRVASAKWEVIGYKTSSSSSSSSSVASFAASVASNADSDPASDGETTQHNDLEWLLVYAHKSIFTAPAVNWMVRRRVGERQGEGISAEESGKVRAWLEDAGKLDEAFRGAVDGMVEILRS